MSLLFLTNGLLTTLQDAGRFGFQRLGINPNGAMDKRAVSLINILLGNAETEAALEMHFPAPRILFENGGEIALGGADFGAKINGKEIANWRIYEVKTGDVLSFERKKLGNRVYLSIRGGFQIEAWLNSFSTNLKAGIGGFNGRALQKNDRLFFRIKNEERRKDFNYRISDNLVPNYSASPQIRVIAGIDWDKLNKESRNSFLTQTFKIGKASDRMGFRLEGEALILKERLELISSAVNFGTIQLPPDGKPIILMADHQTTGGYPRVAHVASVDLPLVSQLGANDSLRFKMISRDDAENLLIQFENELNWLKIGCGFKLSER